MKKKKPLPHFRKHLARRLQLLSDEMAQIGDEMLYYDSLGPIGQHGLEMIGAAQLVKGWLYGLADSAKTP